MKAYGRWNGGVMVGMKKWMLGAAIAAGTLGLAAAPAQAARVGIYVRGPVAYVPPCPGPGYVWLPGYYARGVWVAGYWNFVEVRGVAPIVRFGHGPVYGRYFYRDRHRW